MSNKAITWARSVRGLKPTAKLVLVLLADHANKDGRAWPSVELLAGDVEVTSRSIIRTLNDLETSGLISRVSRGNQFRPSVYAIGACDTGVMSPKKHVTSPVMSTPDIPNEHVTPVTEHVTNDVSAHDIAVSHEPHRTPNRTPTTTTVPTWLETLAHDARFPAIESLNGFRERVEDFGVKHPDVDLNWQAEQAYLWLQQDTAKARGRKDLPRFFMRWLDNKLKFAKRDAVEAQAQGGSRGPPRRAEARPREDFR